MGSRAAVQMYTLRDQTKTASDFADSLKKISDIGYEAVQLSAVGCMGGDGPEVDAADGRKMLDDNGLETIATHRGWDDLANETQREIDFHQTLGCTYTAIGGIPGPYREKGADGFREFVKDSAATIARLKEAGITWGYHNHAHEFVRYAPGPKTWYDIFIDEGGPDFTLELDTYWAVHAGADPIAIFDRCQGRVPVIHVKDKEVVDNEAIMAPIGEGNLNWDGIIESGQRAGVEWYAVEQDRCYRDPFDCLKSSFEFLVSKGV
ncbi:MAG: sugar phosphate isomerase/epimerase [Planctomycetota bacterium]|nr:sugar phosphate isomerase/epimerase [Planctomycetota bacterium]MDP7249153.1 sugar phosphate isomerase/epimerase [Planctomycetota bacterium]